MKLVLFDNIDAENINALKNSKFIENAEFFSVETVDVSSLSNYEKIDLFVGLTLNFFSQNFMSFVDDSCRQGKTGGYYLQRPAFQGWF